MKHWYNKILLKSKEPVEGIDERAFFEVQVPNPTITNRETFMM